MSRIGDIERHLARNTVPECKAQAVCVNGRHCIDAGRCLRAGEVAVVPAADLKGAVEAERERIIERIHQLARMTLPDDVSRTALTIEKVAAVLTREGQRS